MFWILLLPLVIFFPYLGQILFQPGSAYSDLLISHYPNALFIQQSIFQWKQIPLWSSSILSGYPFSANPLSGLWYPPGWIALFFSLPLGINLTVLLHLFWGGFGTYKLIRSYGLHPAAAIIGALIFEAFPKTIAHYAAGHITLIYAVSWTPWLIYMEQRRVSTPWWKRGILNPGVILGIIFLADVRWGAYAGLLWFAYSLIYSELMIFQKSGLQGRLRTSAKYLRYAIAQITIAFLMAAPILLPLFQYTQLSSRASLTAADFAFGSLPLNELINLFFPNFYISAEWVLYPYAVGLVLTVYLLASSNLRERAKFWVFLAVVALVYSCGSQLPGLTLLARVPGINLLRVPPRAIFLMGLSIAILAAYSIDALMMDVAEKRVTARWDPSIYLTALAAFIIFIPTGIWYLSKSVSINLLWGAGMVSVTALWVILRHKNKLPSQIWSLGLTILCLVDVGFISYHSFVAKNLADMGGEAKTVAAYLKSQPGYFRTYSPSYSIPQDVAAQNELEISDGVDPLQLDAYVKYMEGATGIPNHGYSVTLPSYENGDPDTANQGYIPDAAQLGLLNVQYVVSKYDLDCDQLQLIARVGETRIYQNQAVFPRAWVVRQNGTSTSRDTTVKISRYTPNQIDLEANGKGLLVLSELNYPGWVVWVDGKRTEIQTVDLILRGVPLGPGLHSIVFEYRPLLVYLGIGCSITILVILVGIRALMGGFHDH